MLENSPHHLSRDMSQYSNFKKKIEVSQSTSFFEGISASLNKKRSNSVNRLVSPKIRNRQVNSSNDNIISYNSLIKNPFKHHSIKIPPLTSTNIRGDLHPLTSRRPVDPAEELIEKTAKGITQFIFNFEIQKQKQAISKNNNPNSFRPPKPRFIPNQGGGGLKPLNHVGATGPSMSNCLGIIKEPTNINFQLKEIYEKKCELLAKKRTMLEQQITYPVKLFEHNMVDMESKMPDYEN